MLVEPQNVEEFRTMVTGIIRAGGFAGASHSLIEAALDEICLVLSLEETPSPCQQIIGRTFLRALEGQPDEE